MKRLILFIAGVLCIITALVVLVSNTSSSSVTPASTKNSSVLNTTTYATKRLSVGITKDDSTSERTSISEEITPEESIKGSTSDTEGRVTQSYAEAELNNSSNNEDIPAGHSFKSYTSYRALNRSSTQWKLQELAYSDDNGLRKVGEYYCVALGSYYGTTVGDCYTVTLSTDNSFKITLCDCKDDQHTDESHRWTRNNGCMAEFYVDYTSFNKRAKSAGDISVIEGFEGDVVSIEQIEGMNVFNESED